MGTESREDLPIDRGWAWVICGACMGAFALISGSFKGQGIIFVELKERFPHESATRVLWVVGLSHVFNRLAGPLNSVFLAKTSHRTVAMTGLTLVSISLATIGFLPRIEYMYPVYGVVYGLGAGMVTLVSFTAYTQYFEEKKALAVGITAAGSGVGTIAVPPLLRFLFDGFPFSYATLYYGGVALQFVILAALLRPISYYKNLANWRSSRKIKSEEFQSDTKCDEKNTCVDDAEKGCEEETTCRRHDQKNVLLKPSLSKESHNSKSNRHADASSLIMYNSSNSLNDVVMYTHPSEEEGEDKPNAKKKAKFDWHVAISPHSVLIGLGIIAYSSGVGVVYNCIPPLGKEAGVSKDTIAIMLTCAGALEIPCRISNGLLADRKIFSAITQLACCMIFTGVAALLCGIISGLPGIAIMLIGMSTAGTSVFSLLPIVCGDLLGSDNVASALGVNFVYQAVATIISTFTAGKLYEMTGRWENVYFFVFGVMTLGGLINAGHSLYVRFKKKSLEQS